MGILSSISSLYNKINNFGRTTPQQEAEIRAKLAKETKTEGFVKAIPLALGAGAITSGFSAGFTAIKTFTSAVIPKVVQAFIPTTTKGKVLGVTALAVGVPLVVESKKTQEVISKIPEQVINLPTFGADVGDYIDNPSVAKLEKIAKENPLLLALIASAVLVAGGKALSIYNSWKQTSIAKENLKINKELVNYYENSPPMSNNLSDKNISTLPPAVIPTNTSTPALPETIALSPTSNRKKRRHTSLKQPLNLIQKTSITINNNNLGTKSKTKRYINARVL